jgi:hypothetical protein
MPGSSAGRLADKESGHSPVDGRQQAVPGRHSVCPRLLQRWALALRALTAITRIGAVRDTSLIDGASCINHWRGRAICATGERLVRVMGAAGARGMTAPPKKLVFVTQGQTKE